MLKGLWCGTAVLVLVGGRGDWDRDAAAASVAATASATSVASSAAASAATLGPPTICFPIEIGDAQSIPFGGGEHTAAKYRPYERVEGDRLRRESVRFIADTLELLKVETPPLVRMETLRRATFYAYGMADGAEKPPAWAAERLLAEVLARALNAEASEDKARRLAAWLDAAWLRACYSDLSEHASTQAYDWLQRGLVLGGAEIGEYDFAASVLTMHAKALGRDSLEGYHAEHVRRAARKAEEGSLLAKNLLARFGGEGATLAKLRGP